MQNTRNTKTHQNCIFCISAMSKKILLASFAMVFLVLAIPVIGETPEEERERLEAELENNLSYIKGGFR